MDHDLINYLAKGKKELIIIAQIAQVAHERQTFEPCKQEAVW